MAIAQRNPVPANRGEPGKVASITTATAAAPPREKIAARAYEIWQDAGCPDGQHEAHWYQAERELRQRQSR